MKTLWSLSILTLVCGLSLGCSTEPGEGIMEPPAVTGGPPVGGCGEVARVVGAIIREGMPQDRVELFAKGFGFEHLILWFQVAGEVRVVGGNAEDIESALAGSPLVDHVFKKLGGVYKIVFRPLVEESEAVAFIETISGLDILRVWVERPTVVRFVVPEGQEDHWMARFASYPIVEFAARLVSCPV